MQAGNSGMSSKPSSRKKDILSLGEGMNEINVTPLVDVILVLLIIFMVTAPMMKQGIDIALPQASERLFPEELQNRYILSIAADRQIYLDNKKIPREHLEFKLRSLNTSTHIEALFLEADKSLDYGYVVEVMDIIKNAGIKTMGMVTKPKTIQK